MKMTFMSKQYDIIVYGASSFVGQILTQYLSCHLTGKSEIKWALAGRNKAKLAQVQASTETKDIDVIIADASDSRSLDTLCRQAKVIISTVGPYALYGEPLIKSCVENGTDYVDLTGEVQWIDRMLKKYEEKAKKSGSRIINCCGFDSIPSDMGAYFLQQQAQLRFGQAVPATKMAVKKIRGGTSGGTIASVINLAKEAIIDPSLRKKLLDPYLICPDSNQHSKNNLDNSSVFFDSEFDAWTTPFIMAGINTRVVFRTNTLMNYAYGKDFQYSEVMLTGNKSGSKLNAKGMAFGIKAFLVLAAMAPSRWFLEKYLVPKPGEGPTPKEQEEGFFDIRHLGKTEDGEIIEIKVTGDKDPGYGSTGKMLAQAALCLANDVGAEEKGGGFWTPASIFGSKLITRLEAHAGLTFELVDK